MLPAILRRVSVRDALSLPLVISLLEPGALFAQTRSQESSSGAPMEGPYAGQYQCGGQARNFTLRVTRTDKGIVRGEAVFPQQVVLYSPRAQRTDRAIAMNGAIDDQGTRTLRTDDELILAYNQPRTRITLRGRADPENGYLVGAVDYPTCERFVLVPGATSGNYLAAAAYAKVLAGGDEKARTAATVGNAPEVARAAPISAASVAAASVAASPVPAEPVASASVVPPAPPPARSSSAEPERAAQQREAVAVPAEASVLYLRALEAEGRGDNVQNLQEAAQLYERAARLGYIQAYTSLGYLYQTGAGVQSDTARAFDLYKRAAEGGHAEGAFQLAIAYINGIGTTRELSSARIWMRRAADSAHQHAQFALGEMFREGHGGNVNKFTARRYFDRASKGPDKEIADAARQFRDGIDGAELASDWWSKNSIVANVALFVGLTVAARLVLDDGKSYQPSKYNDEERQRQRQRERECANYALPRTKTVTDFLDVQRRCNLGQYGH